MPLRDYFGPGRRYWPLELRLILMIAAILLFTAGAGGSVTAMAACVAAVATLHYSEPGRRCKSCSQRVG